MILSKLFAAFQLGQDINEAVLRECHLSAFRRFPVPMDRDGNVIQRGKDAGVVRYDIREGLSAVKGKASSNQVTNKGKEGYPYHIMLYLGDLETICDTLSRLWHASHFLKSTVCFTVSILYGTQKSNETSSCMSDSGAAKTAKRKIQYDVNERDQMNRSILKDTTSCVVLCRERQTIVETFITYSASFSISACLSTSLIDIIQSRGVHKHSAMWHQTHLLRTLTSTQVYPTCL